MAKGSHKELPTKSNCMHKYKLVRRIFGYLKSLLLEHFNLYKK
jgi:hypothetical protein